MTVKVKKRIKAMGAEFDATIYMPEDLPLTRERREKADTLDLVLMREIEKINKEYDVFQGAFQKNEMQKWRWLGQKIDEILKAVPLIEKSDIDNNCIWPAIGQYLRSELSRGMAAADKRSGTNYDHYRKCWALYSMPGTKWIHNWTGWDAFTERSEQLIYSRKFLPLLGKKFSHICKGFKSDDYVQIVKLTAKHIPAQGKTRKAIDSMSKDKLDSIVQAIFQDFMKTYGKCK